MSFPVGHVLDLPAEQVIVKVSDDEMYQCVAKKPGIARSEALWQIRKIINNTGVTPPEYPVIRYAENSIEYKFKQTDWNTLTYPDPA